MNTIKKAADINICLGLVLENKNKDIRVQLFKLLIEKGADPNTVVNKKTGQTLLIWVQQKMNILIY